MLFRNLVLAAAMAFAGAGAAVAADHDHDHDHGSMQSAVRLPEACKAASAGKEVSGCDDTVSKKLHNPNQRVTSGRLY